MEAHINAQAQLEATRAQAWQSHHRLKQRLLAIEPLLDALGPRPWTDEARALLHQMKERLLDIEGLLFEFDCWLAEAQLPQHVMRLFHVQARILHEARVLLTYILEGPAASLDGIRVV